jgi:hypothetical protein
MFESSWSGLVRPLLSSSKRQARELRLSPRKRGCRNLARGSRKLPVSRNEASSQNVKVRGPSHSVIAYHMGHMKCRLLFGQLGRCVWVALVDRTRGTRSDWTRAPFSLLLRSASDSSPRTARFRRETWKMKLGSHYEAVTATAIMNTI